MVVSCIPELHISITSHHTLPSHHTCHHIIHAITMHHIIHAITSYIPSHHTCHHIIHAITSYMPSHHHHHRHHTIITSYIIISSSSPSSSHLSIYSHHAPNDPHVDSMCPSPTIHRSIIDPSIHRSIHPSIHPSIHHPSSIHRVVSHRIASYRHRIASYRHLSIAPRQSIHTHAHMSRSCLPNKCAHARQPTTDNPTHITRTCKHAHVDTLPRLNPTATLPNNNLMPNA